MRELKTMTLQQGMDFKEANMAYLQDLSGGDVAIIKEMITLFLNQTPKDLAKLGQNIVEKDWEGTHRMAHHMKPTLGYVGAEGMRREFEQIERMAKLPEVPVDELSHRFQMLSPRFETLFEELNVYRDRLS